MTPINFSTRLRPFFAKTKSYLFLSNPDELWSHLKKEILINCRASLERASGLSSTGTHTIMLTCDQGS